MKIFRTRLFRAIISGLALIGCVGSAAAHESFSTAPAGNLKRLCEAGPIVREMVERFGFLFDSQGQQALRSAAQELVNAGWYRQTNNPAFDDLSISICQLALARIERALDSAPMERLSEGTTELRVKRNWVSGSGMILVRIEARASESSDDTPAFVRETIDLKAGGDAREVALPGAPIVYAVFYVANAAHDSGPVRVTFNCRGKTIGKLQLNVEVPRAGRFRLAITDMTSGGSVPAVAGLYAADHQLLIPPAAAKLNFWQNGGPSVQSRSYQTCRYWPGSSWEREVFFVEGGFDMPLPEGEYQLIIAKGPEYEPVVGRYEVKAGATTEGEVKMKRWVDMPGRGWISGDGHIHFSRRDEGDNPPLLSWIKAEDVHIGNVLRMGDANATYFEQYAFGLAGRVSQGGYSLISGQEDPRTEDLGHVLGINLEAPARFPTQYHLYKTVFDAIHAQGGLAGYAHVYQPPRPAFWVRRDMTLNIPGKMVDFLEVAEFGDVDDRLYNEFLNLGFKLAATGGSDVPWGESVGISRTYAYTGGDPNPDAWFSAIRQGRTFVTAGPMLMLKVNGQLPGAEISVNPGETVHIEASAEGWIAKPKYLEIVAQGDVIAAAKPSSTDERKCASVCDLVVKNSTWITARCSGALTSPVYVRVGNESWWKREAVPEIVKTRLVQLEEIEALALRIESGYTAGYADPDRLRKQLPRLREQVAAARELYNDLRREAQSTENHLSSGNRK